MQIRKQPPLAKKQQPSSAATNGRLIRLQPLGREGGNQPKKKYPSRQAQVPPVRIATPLVGCRVRLNGIYRQPWETNH